MACRRIESRRRYQRRIEDTLWTAPGRFLWQDVGDERHVFFSSLDELTIRLNLDATHVPGVTPGEAPQQSEHGAEGMATRPLWHAGSGRGPAEKTDAGRKRPRMEDADLPDVDVGDLIAADRSDDDDLEVNVQSLLKERYVPPTHHDRSASLSRKDVTRLEADVIRSPILRRQDVSRQFGKMNAAMLDESAKAVENVDALALNDGLESMCRATIDQMESEETKELVRGHAALVMDPVGEGSE